MKVAILSFDQCTTISSIGSYDMLNKVNEFAREMGIAKKDQSLFEVDLVGINGKVIQGVGGIAVTANKSIEEIDSTDLIIISAIDNSVDAVIENNSGVFPWIRKMYDQGASVASLCTGAFVLAETGLLDNKSATTHWLLKDLFTQKFPSVQLKVDKIIVDEGRLMSSGGATSFLTAILYLVEKYGGKELAGFTSKVFLIEPNRSPQNSFAIFSPQKEHNDGSILKVQQYIEENYSTHLPADSLAELASMSKRTFLRKFKAATGNTPLEYLQRVRVEAAKKELERTEKNVDHIIENIGYEDLPSFRKLFSRYTGFSMSQYRKRFRMLAG